MLPRGRWIVAQGQYQPLMVRSAQGGTAIPTDMHNLILTTLYQMSVKQNDTGQWYIDSEVATHVTGNVNKFINLISYKGHGTIVTGNGSLHLISHTGNVTIPLQSTYDVLLTLTIKKNIILVSKLIDECSSRIHFFYLSE